MQVFDQQIKAFEESLRALNRSKSTIEIYKQAVKKLTLWMIEQNLYEIRELTRERIIAFQRDYHTQAQEKGYSVETVHTHLRGMKRFLEYLEKTHQLLASPSEAIEMPPLYRHRTIQDTLTELEMRQMIECWQTDSWKGLRNRALLELIYSTGLRLSEIKNLDLEDIDEKSGYVRVRGGKGAKDRVQPLGRKACRAVSEYLKKARPYLLRGRDERALFLSYISGQRLEKWRIAATIKESAQRTKIPKAVSTHTLRRTFATHLLRNDAHPYYVKELLGHSGMETIGRYIKVAGLDLKKEHQRTHPRERAKEGE